VDKVAALVDLAAAGNMNTLRLWGGGVWAGHTLLDRCDERGILLWHDLLFACSKYPADRPEFLADVEHEVAWGIRELSPHPSLVVWCGNNEIEAGDWEWGYKQFGRTVPDYHLFHQVIPTLVARLDPTRPYWPSSPYSDAVTTPGDPTVGDTHPWSVSLGADDIDFWAYRRHVDRFPNEGGVLGCAPVASLQRFLSPVEIEPRSFAWEHHDNTITFWRSEPGFPYRQVEYFLGCQVKAMPLESYAIASGLMQAEGLKEYIHNFRRRWPSTSSAIYWMFNDSWPTVHGWGTIDYYLNRKLAFHPVRRAFADLLVVLADEGDAIGVYVVNDSSVPADAHLQTGSFDPADDRLDAPLQECRVPAFTSLKAQILPRDPQRIAYAVLSDPSGRVLAQDRLLLRPFHDWKIPTPEIKYQAVERDGKLFTRYQCDTWVWGVILDPAGEAPVTDDVFDLLPGIPYEVALLPGETPRPVAFTGNALL
jgi:beta-mannosidase